MKTKLITAVFAVIIMVMASAASAYADENDIAVPPSDQQAVTGWSEDGTSYTDESGNAVTGIYIIDGVVYLFSEEGILQKDTYALYDGRLMYFSKSDGAGSALDTGDKRGPVKMEDGRTYYVCQDGSIYEPAGAGVKKMDNGKRYYFYKKGYICVRTSAGISKIGGKSYYFNSDSSVKSNGTTHFMTVSGKTYYVSRYGYLLTGWRTVNGNRYWMSTVSCVRFENRLASIGGSRYWFGEKGKMKKSVWKYNDSGYKKYYFSSSGKMVTNTSKYIGGYKYYFNRNGVVQRNLITYKGFSWVASHAIKISVNRTRNTITIYARDGNKGYTIPVVAFACTVGTASRPTDKGVFYTGQIYRWKKLGGRTPWQDNGEEVYGQFVTHFNGAMYLHSVCYWVENNNRTLITEAYNNLGNAGSHGCVRLRCGDAQTIYRLAARQSCKVVVYDSKYAGPFGKPVYKKISTNYDPTDPNI